MAPFFIGVNLKKLLFLYSLIGFYSCNPGTELKKTCLEGHLYWSNEVKMANILDDRGRPVRCGEKLKLTVEQGKFLQLASKGLSFLDNGKLMKFYGMTTPDFKKSVTPDNWKKAYQQVEEQVGKIRNRKVYEVKIHDEWRVTVIFHSVFAKDSNAKELVHLSSVDGKWMVAGIFVKPRD